MSDYAGARLAARKRWDATIWDVRSAEHRHGVGSPEWREACEREFKAQQAYHDAARLHRANCPIHRVA